jgi:uncharacterized protein YjbJ (UPF0337 family)
LRCLQLVKRMAAVLVPKDAVGGLTSDSKLQAEGKLDKAKGSARQAVGDVKDATRDAADKLKD